MKHILIVEDDIGILDGLTFLLEENYRVTATNNPRVALEKLKTETPDLIIVDLVMPIIDGATFVKLVVEQFKQIPIIVMTASSDTEVQLKGLKVAALLRKPFEIVEIENKIALLLASTTST